MTPLKTMGAWFAGLTGLVLVAQAMTWGLCAAWGTAPLAWGGNIILVGTSLAAAAVGASAVASILASPGGQQAGAGAVRIAELEQALAERAEQHRRLRHDLRGVLSPALLTAERLLNSPEPSVKRAGQMMVHAVERSTALMLDEPVSPPAGP